MSPARRCIHGGIVAADDSACPRCGPVAQLAHAAAPPARGDARTERDRGIAAALDRPAASWDRAVVDQAIGHLASTRRRFSANDLRPLLPAVSPAIIGAAFLAAAKAGTIERVGDVQATHSAGHARRVALWRGVLAPPPLTLPTPRPEPAPEPPRRNRETTADKAARLLAAGRVRVRRVDPDGLVVADVGGDSGTYTVRRVGGRWSCPCQAGRHGSTCGHVAAVRLVVTP